MTEYELLQDLYKDYKVIHACKEEINDINESLDEFDEPTIISNSVGFEKSQRIFKLTLKLWYLFIYILSAYIFFVFILQFVIPFLGNYVEFFNHYDSVPQHFAFTLYKYIFLGVLILPLLFLDPDQPDKAIKTHRIPLIFTIVILIIGYIIGFVLKYFTDEGVFSEMPELGRVLMENTDIYAIHFFLFSLIFLIISKLIFKRRYKRIQKKMNAKSNGFDNSRLHNEFPKSESKSLLNRLSELYDHIDSTENKLRNNPYFEALDKEPLGFFGLMEYFAQGRVESIEEANYIYEVEMKNEKIYNQNVQNIDSHLDKVLKNHNQKKREIERALEIARKDYQSKSINQAMSLVEREKLYYKVKHKN